jgi:hypothetical protein
MGYIKKNNYFIQSRLFLILIILKMFKRLTIFTIAITLTPLRRGQHPKQVFNILTESNLKLYVNFFRVNIQ